MACGATNIPHLRVVRVVSSWHSVVVSCPPPPCRGCSASQPPWSRRWLQFSWMWLKRQAVLGCGCNTLVDLDPRLQVPSCRPRPHLVRWTFNHNLFSRACDGPATSCNHASCYGTQAGASGLKGQACSFEKKNEKDRALYPNHIDNGCLFKPRVQFPWNTSLVGRAH